MQEEGRVVIGVRNNNGRAKEAAEMIIGRGRKEENAGVVAAAAYGRGGVEVTKR